MLRVWDETSVGLAIIIMKLLYEPGSRLPQNHVQRSKVHVQSRTVSNGIKRFWTKSFYERKLLTRNLQVRGFYELLRAALRAQSKIPDWNGSKQLWKWPYSTTFHTPCERISSAPLSPSSDNLSDKYSIKSPILVLQNVINLYNNGHIFIIEIDLRLFPNTQLIVSVIV